MAIFGYNNLHAMTFYVVNLPIRSVTYIISLSPYLGLIDNVAECRRIRRPRIYNMRMTRVLFILAILFLSQQWCVISYGEDMPGSASLMYKYQTIEKDLEKSPLIVPFHLESSVNKNASLVDIWGTVKYPLGAVADELQIPANWCDIIMPHINIRACTSEKKSDTWLLTVYNVNRYDEPIKDAYKMKFEYASATQQPGYFKVLLEAPEGPFSTKAHQFMFEAIALDEGTTFVHFRYAFSYSFLEYFAMKSYFSIFDRGKTGFSVASTDSAGNVSYVKGFRGALERNVVLYYLGIHAYMDTRNVPFERRFEKRISQWYDLRTQYKRQFFEIGKEEYLSSKRLDLVNQLKLQDAKITRLEKHSDGK